MWKDLPVSDGSSTADLDRLLATLGVGAAGAAWREGWAASQASFAPRDMSFVEPGFVRAECDELGLSADVGEAVAASVPMFEAFPELKRLAWHCHARLFRRPAEQVWRRQEAIGSWPMLPGRLHEGAPLFYAVVLISGGPLLRELHRARGIADEVTRQTVGDLELWMRHYRRRTGRWGLAQLGWLAGHFTGRLFQLGRLQFRFERFGGDFRAFRRRSDGRVVLLAGDGLRFRADGQFDGANGVRDAENAWTSVFRCDERVIHGHPVSPRGMALPEAVELPAERWPAILRKGDPILGVHIPATGPMTHAACGESFRRAVAFFGRHFPERPFRAFHCGSWLLDNQFELLLPASSNICRFQREVYLYPLPGAGGEQTFERVFGGRLPSMEDAPRDTALRRAIVAHVRGGGHCRGGGCLLFPDDLRWGEEVYRTGRALV